MMWRLLALGFFYTISLRAEKAEILYYNFVGDYLIEDSYQVDVDVPNTNLGVIKTMLEASRANKDKMDTDLVVIGYGLFGAPQEFFAASPMVNYEVLLKNVLQMPAPIVGAKWYFYFVNRSLSHYVRERQDHHWSSPHRGLANIGLQDLYYFGPL